MNLYIIGNGFDIAHGLKTSYWDFRSYLEEKNEEFLIEFEKMYGHYAVDLNEYHIPEKRQKEIEKRRNDHLYDTMWKAFEYSLGYADEGEMLNAGENMWDQMDMESGPIGIEDTLNLYWEEQYGFVLELQDYLFEWVKQINLSKTKPFAKELLRNSQDLFLTFNYTPVLERVYHISEKQICHIHGGIPPYCLDVPTIGHGNAEVISMYREKAQKAEEDFDEITTSINNAIATFYQRTFKNTQEALQRNRTFFDKTSGVEEINIIGHSLGEVDMPYFERIFNKVTSSVKWNVFYHKPEEEIAFRAAIANLGVKNIRTYPSSLFFDIS